MVTLRQIETILVAQTVAIVGLLYALFREGQANPFLMLWLSQNLPLESSLLDVWAVSATVGFLIVGVTVVIVLAEIGGGHRLVREAADRTASGLLAKTSAGKVRKKRRSIPLHSILFLSTGTVSLAASVLNRISELAFSGLGLIFLGMIPIYLTYEHETGARTHSVPYSAIAEAIDSPGSQVVYLPREDDRTPASAFVLEKGKQALTLGRSANLKVIEPPGASLLGRLERAMEIDFGDVKPSYLIENLTRMVVDDLGIASSFRISKNIDRFRVTVEGDDVVSACEAISRISPSLDSLGCEFCSAIALGLAKSTGKPVIIEDTVVTGHHAQIDTTFRVLTSLDRMQANA